MWRARVFQSNFMGRCRHFMIYFAFFRTCSRLHAIIYITRMDTGNTLYLT